MADAATQAESFKNQGNAALKDSDFDKAIEFYTKVGSFDQPRVLPLCSPPTTQAIELSPNHVYYSNRSAAYLSKGDAESALTDAEACIKANPSWGKGYGRKGAALHALSRLSEAVGAYQEGLKHEPSNASLTSGLQDVQRALMQNPFHDLVTYCATHPKFRAHMSDPTFVMNLQMLQRNPQALGAVASDPRMMEVIGAKLGIDLAGAAAAGGEEGDMPESSPATATHAEEEAQPADTGADASSSMAEMTEEERAMEEERRAIEEEKRQAREELARLTKQADALKEEGNAHYKRREFSKAIELYTRAIEVLPKEITYRLNRAAAHFEAGDLEACAKECNEAIEVGRSVRPPPFAKISKAFIRLGNIECKRGDLPRAIEFYEKAQTESFSDPIERKIRELKRTLEEEAARAYLDKDKAIEAKEAGNAAFKAGDFPEAIAQYSEAIKRDPENAVYWNNRATARCKIMDFGGAMTDCETAMKLDPTYLKSYARKARIQILNKEYHKALDTVSQGLDHDETHVELREVMAELQSKIERAMYEAPDPVRQQRAMADPEIQSMLRDPMVRQALSDLSTDPTAMAKLGRDPQMARKINRLILAGVVSFGGPGSAAAAGEDA
jgi:stress-induced-phosphoprotein 1